MKKKVIGSLLAIGCILPTSVMASQIEIEQEETVVVGGSVTLNFNSNGGTDCSSMTLPVASTPTTYELPIPMKAGHTFKGWFTDNNIEITGENLFNAFTNVISGETATVKAKWEKQEVLTKTSSISKEDIPDSEEYYEVIQATENFADGSKIVINTKTKKIEDYIIEETTTYTYYNQDGSTTQEAIAAYHGYSEYQRAKAKNDLTVTVVDINGKPVEGFEINFKTEDENINLKTDKDGKIVHYFKKATYETKVVTIPSGYALNQPVEKLGLGKMYSISYVENYVLDLVDIGEPPIILNKEEVKPNIIVTEEKVEEKTEDKKEEEKKEETQKPAPVIKVEETVQEKPDPNNKEVVKAPQTGDNTSFMFLGLLPISLAFLLKKKH